MTEQNKFKRVIREQDCTAGQGAHWDNLLKVKVDRYFIGTQKAKEMWGNYERHGEDNSRQVNHAVHAEGVKRAAKESFV